MLIGVLVQTQDTDSRPAVSWKAVAPEPRKAHNGVGVRPGRCWGGVPLKIHAWKPWPSSATASRNGVFRELVKDT